LNCLAAPNKTPRARLSIHPANLAEEPFAVRIVAILLGLIFLAIAIVYWVVPAGQLPTFVPGYQAGSELTHLKHGIASAVVAVVLFGIGWYVGRSR
jgi:hypothetical protein